MKPLIRCAALLAATLSVPAAALDVTRAATQSGAYFSLAFGGPQSQPARFHYGLNFGRTPGAHDSAGRAGVLSFDFGPATSMQALLGGLPLLPQQHTSLGEAETTPPADAAWYNVTQWGSTQWGVVAGAGVLGYVFARDRKQKDTPGAPPAPPGAAPAAPVDVCAPGELPVIGGGCISDVGGGGYTDSRHGISSGTGADDLRLDDEYGHMGDLIAIGARRR